MGYVGSANTVVSNGAGTYLFVLKNALKDAGWEVLRSSLGSGNPSDNEDLLDTAAKFGAANAWARLREPSVPGGIGQREYILQNGTANGTTAIIKYSRATGFNTGGSGAVAPTTGVGGDGQVLIGTHGSTDASPTAATIGNASGYVAAVASDTASPGVYGGYSWYLMGYTAGGANVSLVMTEAVTPGSTSSLDQDPMWRFGTGAGVPSVSFPPPWQLGGPWYSNGILGVQYWQAYGISSAPPYYVRGGQSGFVSVRTPSSTTFTFPVNNFISSSPYDGREPMYPMMIGQASVPTGYNIPACIPKGYTTGIVTFSTTHNLLDTFNLNTSDPKIAIALTGSGLMSVAMPWLPGVIPSL